MRQCEGQGMPPSPMRAVVVMRLWYSCTCLSWLLHPAFSHMHQAARKKYHQSLFVYYSTYLPQTKCHVAHFSSRPLQHPRPAVPVRLYWRLDWAILRVVRVGPTQRNEHHVCGFTVLISVFVPWHRQGHRSGAAATMMRLRSSAGVYGLHGSIL